MIIWLLLTLPGQARATVPRYERLVTRLESLELYHHSSHQICMGYIRCPCTVWRDARRLVSRLMATIRMGH